MKSVSQSQASRLLHNKFVVVLGDSIQRSVYKDLVLLLQRDKYLTMAQLKSKGEMNFEQDCLVEGGRLGLMNNGTEYREVRQFRSNHHLVRFYFVTRIYSRYMESVLADFENGLKPDMVIINSCVWDLSRYGPKWVMDYRENLHKFFEQIKRILPPESLIMWNMTMPLGRKIIGGFLVPEVEHMAPTLRYDVIEANFYSATLADAYGLDVLDLHYHFRFSLQHRTRDGVHWNAVAHRNITCLLLEHAAQAWGVELHDQASTSTTTTTASSSKVPLPARPTQPKQKRAKKQRLLPYSYNRPPQRDSYRYGGPCGNKNDYNDRYMASRTPAVRPYRHDQALPWSRPPPPRHYGAQGYAQDNFCDDTPFGTMSNSIPYNLGYVNFEDRSHAGGHFGGMLCFPRPPHPAPLVVDNYFVMKNKPARNHFAPYNFQRPNTFYRY